MTLSLVDPEGRGREMLGRMARQDGPDSDTAHELLKWLDEQVDAEAELAEWDDRVGDRDEADKSLTRLALLDEWAGEDVTFKEFGDLDQETLERFARAYDRYEQESFALQELCVEAGLIAHNDFDTNPLPLLRMFLPID